MRARDACLRGRCVEQDSLTFRPTPSGSNAPSPPFRYCPKKGREHIIDVLDQGVAAGMSVLRVWSHSVTDGWSMINGAGSYNESIIEGLDFIVAEAGKVR